MLKNYNDYLLYQHKPTPTHRPTTTTTPLANMFTLTTLLAASGFLLSTSHALEFPDSSCAICPPDNQTLTACGQYVFFSLSSLSFPPSQPPPTNTFFSFPSRRFGSCYDFCAESRKEFPVPECNGVSDEVLICEYFKSDCGELFGGCYSNKGPIPGWAVPTCPPASEPSKPEPQTAPKQDPTCQICVDNINDCGA